MFYNNYDGDNLVLRSIWW